MASTSRPQRPDPAPSRSILRCPAGASDVSYGGSILHGSTYGQMTDDSRTTRLRGRMVEGVRLIFMALLGAVGYQLGAARIDANDRNTVLYVFLGAACGYVLGGVFGRLTLEAVSGLERELHRRPAAEIAGGVVGLIVGLVIATLLSVPLFFLPTDYGWPAALFLFIVLGSLGTRVGQDKHEDIFALVGMKPRVSARATGDLHVLDTSALI